MNQNLFQPPRIGSDFPRYASIKTFFQLPIAEATDDHDLSIFGIPFDGGVSYRPGARFGPSSIREISSLGRGFNEAFKTNWMTKLRVADIGDCPTNAICINDTHSKIRLFTDSLMQSERRFIAVGGDHSCTLPLLRSVSARYGPLNLIHFDAHIDTCPLGYGGRVHHGAFLRAAIEENLLATGSIIHIGLRGPFGDEDDLAFSKQFGVQMIDMDTIRERQIKDVTNIIPSFPEGPTYLTFDIDCLDPAYAPGTGTPLPGGLTTYEIRRIIQGLRIKRLVAADVVEVNPIFDCSDITCIAAVDVISEIIGLMAAATHY